jgi:hypothetical protein
MTGPTLHTETPGDIPAQYDPSMVDEIRVPLGDWTDPGNAGRGEDCIVRSID